MVARVLAATSDLLLVIVAVEMVVVSVTVTFPSVPGERVSETLKTTAPPPRLGESIIK
jgi:hypothetical protein